MSKKSMNFIKRLNRGNIYFSNQSFLTICIIGGIKVMEKYKISAQYLKNYACYVKPNTGTWGVNINIILEMQFETLYRSIKGMNGANG